MRTLVAVIFAAGFYTITTIAMLRTRRMTGRTPIVVLREGSPEELAAVAAMWVFPLALIASTLWPDLRLFRLLIDRAVFGLAAAVVLAGGLVLQGVAMMTLGRALRIGVDREHPGPLVRRGPYRYIRHPIYTAFLSYYLGALLLQPNWLFSVVLPVAVVRIVLQARHEEQALRELFGAEYAAYMASTRRFIPRVV